MKIAKADIGIRLTAETAQEHLQAVLVYPEGGSVLLWVHLGPSYKDMVTELLQYLTPQEAMALAKSLEACAIAALKEGA